MTWRVSTYTQNNKFFSDFWLLLLISSPLNIQREHGSNCVNAPEKRGAEWWQSEHPYPILKVTKEEQQNKKNEGCSQRSKTQRVAIPRLGNRIAANQDDSKRTPRLRKFTRKKKMEIPPRDSNRTQIRVLTPEGCYRRCSRRERLGEENHRRSTKKFVS